MNDLTSLLEQLPGLAAADLSTTLSRINPRWLLAYSHEGVIWGRFDREDQALTLTTSADIAANKKQLTGFATLHADTLQHLRAFGPDGELLLWHDGDAWQTRIITTAANAAQWLPEADAAQAELLRQAHAAQPASEVVLTFTENKCSEAEAERLRQAHAADQEHEAARTADKHTWRLVETSQALTFDTFDEHQLLWGTYATAYADWTLLDEGANGMRQLVPLDLRTLDIPQDPDIHYAAAPPSHGRRPPEQTPNTAFTAKLKGESRAAVGWRPAQLRVRHGVRYNEHGVASIAYTRCVELMWEQPQQKEQQ